MDKRFFGILLVPFKKALFEIAVVTLLHIVVVFSLFSIFKTTHVAATGMLWILIISWRCGIGGALIGILAISFGAFIGFHFHPTYESLANIKGTFFGILAQLCLGIVTGSVSRLVTSLKTEIRERAKIQKELEKRNFELDAFGHTVAHDLKNYLSALSMSQTMLSKHLKNTADVKVAKYLNYISDNAVNMANVIEDILLLAGLYKTKNIAFNKISTQEIIRDALKRLHFLIKEKNAEIALPHSYPDLFGYSPWIVNMYINYISNAIKYGGDASNGVVPEVTLGFNTVTDNKRPFVRCWVKDNGSGIEPQIVERMFKEFERYDIKKADGHGFGLSIVKLIAEKLDGTVGVESKLGGGSLFYFTLPKSP